MFAVPLWKQLHFLNFFVIVSSIVTKLSLSLSFFLSSRFVFQSSLTNVQLALQNILLSGKQTDSESINVLKVKVSDGSPLAFGHPGRTYVVMDDITVKVAGVGREVSSFNLSQIHKEIKFNSPGESSQRPALARVSHTPRQSSQQFSSYRC